MMALAAAFMTGMWAVPPAMSREPLRSLNASTGADQAGQVLASRASPEITARSFFIEILLIGMLFLTAGGGSPVITVRSAAADDR